MFTLTTTSSVWVNTSAYLAFVKIVLLFGLFFTEFHTLNTYQDNKNAKSVTHENSFSLNAPAGSPDTHITPLMYFSATGNLAGITTLLEHNVPIDTQAPISKNTALDYALLFNQEAAAIKLIEHNANLSLVNSLGRTAYDIAKTRDLTLALDAITKHELPTTFLFAHGLGGGAWNVDWYTPASKNNWYIITSTPYYSFDFPDVGSSKGKIVYGKVNLGQQDDINALLKEYQKILKTHRFDDPNQGIVLLGSSRGAMTVLNTAGTEQLPRLRAIVAEAPADTAIHALEQYLGTHRYGLDWLSPTLDKALSWWYRSYDPTGISPLQSVSTIPLSVPILLVHAINDDTTSVNSSRILYYQLLKSGHTDVYLLEIDKGAHGKYNIDPKNKTGITPDARKYQVATHAFYKRYRIPYDPQLAKEGENYLAQSQPSLEEIEERIRQSEAYYLPEHN